MKEYDIWNEVLENIGYKFIGDLSFKTCPSSRRTCSIYKKDNECVKLYFKFKTGEVTSFLIDGWEYYKTFQNKNKELFRSVKLDKLGI